MISKKYLKDFRLEDYLDEKGRMRTRAVYAADYYRMQDPSQNTAHNRFLCGAGTVLCWGIWILGLVFDSAAERTIYVILPYVLLSFPMIAVSRGAYRIVFYREPLYREQADEINRHLPAGAMLSVILCGITLVSEIIRAVTGFAELKAGDIVFSVSAVLLGLICRLLSKKAKHMKAVTDRGEKPSEP